MTTATNRIKEDMTHELSVAVELARRAGQAVMDVYATDFAVASKGHNDPVTEADRQANDLIVTGLKDAFPQDTVVAEESPPPDALPAAGRVWYVDPLDGTKEFIARNGEFSVMIGLAVNGQAQLGVVYRPEGDVLYAGVVGREAWMEQRGIRSALAIKEQDPGRPLTLAVSRSHRHPMVEKISRVLGVDNEMPSGSVGLKIGLIARGEADVYLEPGPYTKLWDACAPEAILRAAGGAFTTILGEPLIYGETRSAESVKAQLANTHGLLASNGFCHERVVQALKPAVEELGLKPREA